MKALGEWQVDAASTLSPCCVCDRPTGYVLGTKTGNALRVCPICEDSISHKDPWWLRALRWIVR